MENVTQWFELNKQIILNISVVFILPLVLGAVVRLLIKKSPRAHLFTITIAVVTVVMIIANFVFTTQGSELFGLCAYASGMALVGSLISGGIIRLVRKSKKSKEATV